MDERIPNVFCIRANYGQFTQHCLNGGFTGIGWMEGFDLTTVASYEQLRELYVQYYPDDTSPYVIGQQVGQVGRFLFDIQPGDVVITPSANPADLYWGRIRDNNPYYVQNPSDGCPYTLRRTVDWQKTPVQRSQFSVPVQYSLRSSLTIFVINQKQSFFETIAHPEWVPESGASVQKSYKELILDRILQLDDKEFELLVTGLLRTLGFEAEHTGKSGDEGVDVRGVLDVVNIAQVRLFVQVKRYRPGSNITPRTVRALRSNIPQGSQGAFITTSDFQKQALEVADEPGFPRIGTLNGSQLVDLLTDKWEELEESEELHDFLPKLGLRRGLVLNI